MVRATNSKERILSFVVIARKDQTVHFDSFYSDLLRSSVRAMRYPAAAALVSLSLLSLLAPAQDVTYSPQGQQIPGPRCAKATQWDSGRPAVCSPEDAAAWLHDVEHWRAERKVRVGLDAPGSTAAYDEPALRWTQSSFIQPQMMAHDRFFYNPATRRYTVSRYLDDLKQRYGGIDSVLIWATYPNIGVDDRNQYDLFHDLPGGTAGVRAMVDSFHEAGVRVLFPIMVWDQGTREQTGTLADNIARELAEVGADGINGDTLDGIPRSFAESSSRTHHPLALEPENGLASDEMVAFNTMTWGYWKYDFVPSISRYKWLDTRHMVNLCDRWAHDHVNDLQFAFFNGTGFESWENVWGIWNQIKPRDAEALRRISAIERTFAASLVSSMWQPHALTSQFGVFASRWPAKDRTLWTLVNRNGYAVTGEQLRVPTDSSMHFYDLWNGIELHSIPLSGHESALRFDLEADGYGAVLATTAPLSEEETALLSGLHERARRPLSSFSNVWQTLPQNAEVMPGTAALPQPADGREMVTIPEGDVRFRVHGIEIEGNNDEGVDVQYNWENAARRYHDHVVHIASFAMDKYPVTNADFKRFLDATHYHPADDHNFLRDWHNGAFPQAGANRPVTWISLEDARAFAAWAGKRLPHEWEWQYGAQGTDGRSYPWGESDPSKSKDLVPEVDTGRTMAPASDVAAHPAGVSPFGVMDLVGNVWQWTDEYADTHTRAAILRGGSHYQPQGARWYFPEAYRLDEHGKYLLMAPSLDRSGAVGFRCVRDLR